MNLGLPAHDAVEREILRALKRCYDTEGDGVMSAVLEILKSTESLNFAARFINLRYAMPQELSKIPAFMTLFTDRRVGIALANHLMTKLRGDYDWNKNVDSFNLHRAWFYSAREYGQEEDRISYRNWLAARMRKRYEYEFLVWPFVQLVPNVRGMVAIRYGDLHDYSDLKNLKWGLKKYGDESLLYKMLSKLIAYCEKAASPGRDDEESQIEYLRSDPDFTPENIDDAIESECYIS